MVTSIGSPVIGSSESFLVVLVTFIDVDSVPPTAVDNPGRTLVPIVWLPPAARSA